jgi:hypothetical protein
VQCRSDRRHVVRVSFFLTWSGMLGSMREVKQPPPSVSLRMPCTSLRNAHQCSCDHGMTMARRRCQR